VNQTNIAASGKLISKEIIAVMLGMMLLVSPLCRAAEHPEIVVRALFHELLTELQTHREADTLTHDNVCEVFSRILNPRIDYTALSNWILRDKWTNSSAEQQRQFMDSKRTSSVLTRLHSPANKKYRWMFAMARDCVRTPRS
jgi:ABC-type transporter MlaC component